MDLRHLGAWGFRRMGHIERPVFACRLSMWQHVHHQQQHFLELWTR